MTNDQIEEVCARFCHRVGVLYSPAKLHIMHQEVDGATAGTASISFEIDGADLTLELRGDAHSDAHGAASHAMTLLSGVGNG